MESKFNNVKASHENSNQISLNKTEQRKPSNFCYSTRIFVLVQILITTHLVSAHPLDTQLITRSDYMTLKAIQHEFIDTRGILTSWNNSTMAVCSGGWVGIKCSLGQVIAIQLPWKGLTGKISGKIGDLRALRKLSLHDNAFTGSIPNSIGFLTNLRGVYLFNNKLSGSIPSSIGNCIFLQALDFSNNLLMGSIPSSIVNSTKIFRLNLSFNLLSGSIPNEFSQSKSLIFLDLQFNNLSGAILDNWGGKNNFQLQSLDFGHNLLSGSIPVSLSTILSLTQLDLSENELTGEIPGEFGDMTNLTLFNVSYNNLSGPVTNVLSKKFNYSSFVGNVKLCGYISSKPCASPSSLAPQNFVSPPIEPSKKHHRKISIKDIILISAGVLLLVLLLLCCILLCFLLRKRVASSREKSRKSDRAVAAGGASTMDVGEIESGGESGGRLVHFDGPFVFTADDLLCATAEIMGKTTYGTAYKATLEDGNQVAVKRLREKSTKASKEFETEVSELGKIRHANILALRAYYSGPKGEKLLVSDFMSNGSLASFLHARGPETSINWATRMKIAIGIAQGLKYLHTEKNIIHENLTSSNILLDEHSNPHIAEVGLSRLMTNAANTNMIATAGSTGYRAPELSKLNKANTKTDIYSLGVLILELLTGKSPSDGMNGLDLPTWVASIVKEEWTNEVFDLELMKNETNINDELLNTLNLALHCVDPSPEARPDVTMVVKQFEEIKPELNC